MRITSVRLAAAVLGAGLALATPAVAAPAVHSARPLSAATSVPADAVAGADYLVNQLIDGDHYVDAYSAGQTIDGLLSLLAVGGHADAVAAMTKYLESSDTIDDYADPGATEGGPYSGGLAKLAIAAEATGNDPHDFGGVDLLGLVQKNVCTKALPAYDKYGDTQCTAAGDAYNAYSGISQALAVLALQGSPVAADHLTASSPLVVRLHELQCADGGFSSDLITGTDACTSSVDATGYAIQALAAVPGTGAWLGAAQTFLQKTQDASGSFAAAAGGTLNSSSTAQAAEAFQVLIAALTPKQATTTSLRLAAHRGDVVLAAAPLVPAASPTAAWHSALAGLQNFVVTGGGFQSTLGAGNTQATTTQATTQVVLAAAGSSLLTSIGAPIQSVPLVAAAVTAAPTTSAPTTSAPAASATPGSTAAAAAASDPVANTGADTGSALTLALVLLIAGCAIAWLGRRRVALVVARHRREDRLH